MSVVIVVGAQWGDEGKGKVVDLFTERADVVVRYGGGANAGHTLVVDGQKLVTHLIPSGVCHPGKSCVLGDGMVIDPHTLLDEIAELPGARPAGARRAADRPRRARDPAVPQADRRPARGSGAKRGKAIGTTRRGIGPAYEAKAARRGVRMRDLLRARAAARAGRAQPRRARAADRAPRRHARRAPTRSTAWIDDALAAGERLRAVHRRCRPSRRARDRSGPPRAVRRRAGLPARSRSRHLSVRHVVVDDRGGRVSERRHRADRRSTRSSASPRPTRRASAAGRSRPSCTARPASGCARPAASSARPPAGRVAAAGSICRRCAWACGCPGMQSLALTKLDVLAGLAEVSVCVAYKLDGKELDELPIDPDDIARAEPVYATFAGLGRCRRRARHRATCRPPRARYVETIERTGRRAVLPGLGRSRPRRDDPAARSVRVGAEGIRAIL